MHIHVRFLQNSLKQRKLKDGEYNEQHFFNISIKINFVMRFFNISIKINFVIRFFNISIKINFKQISRVELKVTNSHLWVSMGFVF
jgi:hypothetical protein